MTTYAKRKLKYSRNENFNLLHYVEWDRIVTLTESTLCVTLSYLHVVVNRTHYTRLSMQKCAYDVKQCVLFLIVYLRFFMYKSKEYNGMDILDSIFSDQRQKDVMN
jgi:hypothetical protein